MWKRLTMCFYSKRRVLQTREPKTVNCISNHRCVNCFVYLTCRRTFLLLLQIFSRRLGGVTIFFRPHSTVCMTFWIIYFTITRRSVCDAIIKTFSTPFPQNSVRSSREENPLKAKEGLQGTKGGREQTDVLFWDVSWWDLSKNWS